MKRGFNKFSSENGQESSSEHRQPPNPAPQLNNQLLFNQMAGFANNPMGDNVIMTLFQVVQHQSRALQSLMSKIDIITTRTNQLNMKIHELKRTRNDQRQTDMDENRLQNAKKETLKAGGDILQGNALITILFGGDKKYKYRLKMAKELQLPLYRQRNFNLDIVLTDMEGNTVKNSNKIPLSLALYTSQNPPKFIEKNTAGQKILKGFVQQSLFHGLCHCQKIQIKQVTSHFRNSWVFIVIIPSMTPLGSTNPATQAFIDYTQIQPLVLEKVVVKAKKLKESNKKIENQIEHHQKVQNMSQMIQENESKDQGKKEVSGKHQNQ